MAEWKYVEKDGNPKEEGIYWVILGWEDYDYDMENLECRFKGNMLAKVTTRSVIDITKNPDIASWKMNGQPDEGPVWTEESGSLANEHVLAWIPIEIPAMGELPEGYVEYKE